MQRPPPYALMFVTKAYTARVSLKPEFYPWNTIMIFIETAFLDS